MPLYLTNSLGGRKELFIPRKPDEVRMYVCGPTVYNFAHIGNARPAVVFDVLSRVLRRHTPSLIYARNITDVDDKINTAAAAAGVSIDVVSERYTAAYHADMAALAVAPPTIEPRVTQHIPDIIDLIGRLLLKDHAYQAEGHVLFHVPSFAEYGALSRRTPDEMIAGARIEVAPFKKHPADFVLWKPSEDSQPGWNSPWGRGRPGWHIECSAMIERHLGPQIDIHGGGQDLIFPHHENEIAQGTRANYWLHNGFVTVEGRKMSKSLGNVLLVRDLLREAPGEAIRFALLSAHYRQPLDWSTTGLRQARRSLDRLYATLSALGDVEAEPDGAAPYVATFLAALEDDLNTPKAFAELFRLDRMARHETATAIRAALKAALLEAGSLLGLLQQRPEEWFENAATPFGLPRDQTVAESTEIEALMEERRRARIEKNYAAADRLRELLQSLGVVVEDGDGKTSWRMASM